MRYTIGERAARQISRVVKDYEREQSRSERTAAQRVPVSPAVVQGIYIAKTKAGGIDAVTGSTPGSATVDLYYINDSGALTDTGQDITAYNIASNAVDATTFIQVKQEIYSGKYIVDFEDC